MHSDPVSAAGAAETSAAGADATHATEATEEQPVWPSPPVYDFATRPRRAAEIGVPAYTGVDSSSGVNFFRSARWTADASCVLTTAEDRVLRVYDTTYDADSGAPSLAAPRGFAQPDSVTAALWYPSASAHAPETFCFVAGVRDAPVRLIDATDGRIRASYPIVDHRERFIAPHCMAFTPDATKLYCGFENAIEVLDISRPGYDNSERMKTTFTRREKGGQKGIISALTFSPHHAGSFAAGSFSGSVVLYDEDTSSATGHLEGVRGGGVTQLAYHPLDGNVLFVASRRSDAVQVYDLRDTSAPLASLERAAQTNQRIWVDVEPWGRWVASGDDSGNVRVWDINDPEFPVVFEQKLHEDAVNSVQFHPFKPLILTAAGSRSYLADEADSDSDSGDDSDSGSGSAGGPADHPPRTRAGVKDASLAIWQCGAA